MTSPAQPIEVECPRCGERYTDYYRPSINLSLGETWTDEELEEATSATCPACGCRVAIGDALIVSWGNAGATRAPETGRNAAAGDGAEDAP